MRNEIEGFRGTPKNLELNTERGLRWGLLQLAENNLSSSWPPPELPNSPRQDMEKVEAMAYFVGQGIVGDIWVNTPSARSNPLIPFAGIEQLSLQTDELQNVLLIGCPSSELYTLEQKKLQEAGVRMNTHTTLDISPFPLKRIADAISREAELKMNNPSLVQADSSDMPFMEGAFDMTLTGFVFGSHAENKMLDEAARVTRKGGTFIMRASNFTSEHIAQIAPDLDDIGKFWRDWSLSSREEDQLTQTVKYKELTEDQWVDLGGLYSGFIRKYYSRNRFRSFADVRLYIESGNQFELESFKVRESNLVRNAPPVQYYAVKARRV